MYRSINHAVSFGAVCSIFSRRRALVSLRGLSFVSSSFQRGRTGVASVRSLTLSPLLSSQLFASRWCPPSVVTGSATC